MVLQCYYYYYTGLHSFFSHYSETFEKHALQSLNLIYSTRYKVLLLLCCMKYPPITITITITV